MNVNPNNPIIVQSDKTLLVEVNNGLYTEVRDKLLRFAEVIKSPEYIHTYKISLLSLWNATSSGMSFEDIIEILEKYSKYDIPQNVIKDIEDNINKYGKIKILREGDNRAYFYSIVTADSRDQEFAVKRQLFLAEQGYKYYIETRK